MNGDQFSGFTNHIPTAMKNSTTPSFTQTMTAVVRALSLMPTSNTTVTSRTMIAAGKLATAPSTEPGAGVAQSGSTMPRDRRMLLKYPDQPIATATQATPYSRMRFQPVIQARNSPSVAYE